MRTLSATLEAAQQSASKIPYLHIVVGAYTFGTDRVISFTHTEEPFREYLSIILDNSDDYLTEKNLRGDKVVVGSGFVTGSGNEYSDKSPLHVLTQSFSSSEGRLTCELVCAGVMSELAQDRARKAYKSGVDWDSPTADEGGDWSDEANAYDDNEATYATSGAAATELILTQSAADCRKIRFMKDGVSKVIQVWVFKNDEWFIVFEGARLSGWQETEFPEGSVTKAKILFPDDATQKLYEFDFGNKSSLTLKDLLTGVLDGTFESYDDCTAYTLSYDSEDDIIDDITPGRDFRVPVNGSRVESAKRLLDYTYCVMRPEDDEKIHIFQPTISGEVYDYEYALDAHVFFAKRKSNTITIPNYVEVRSPEDVEDDESYSGYAVDQPSIDAYHEVRYYFVMHGLESNDIAGDIAGAILSKFQMHGAEAGAVVPVNVGAEIYDYVKITDSREGTSVTGNIGYIRTEFSEGKFNQTFGLGGWLSSFKPDISGLPGEGTKYFDELLIDTLYLNPITMDEVIDGEEYKRVLSGMLNAEGLWLLDKIDDDDSDYKKVLATSVSAGMILLSETIQSSSYRTVTDGDTTTWDGKPDDMDDIGEGATYQRVLATNISSGNIKVSSLTSFDGTWYSEGSVTIDATSGIKGTHNGDVTWELRNSDGLAYLCDGGVVIDEDGIHVYDGDFLRFYYSSVKVGAIIPASTEIAFGSYNSKNVSILSSADITLSTVAGAGSGTITCVAESIVLPDKSSYPTTTTNGTMYYDTVSHRVIVRSNGSWKPLEWA